MHKRLLHKQVLITLIFSIVTPTSCINTSTPIAAQNTEYQIVYRDGDFSVREMFLGDIANWDWENFVMPQARITDTVHVLSLGHEMVCNSGDQDLYPCKESINVPSESNTSNTFTLESEYQFGNGNFVLKKNQQIIWIGHMNGGLATPINSVVKYKNNDIAIEYTDSDYDGVKPNFWRADYILITNGYNVSIVDSAFAPNSVFAPNFVDNKLVYFRRDGKKVHLLFNEKEISEYDSVINQYCCWDGPPIQVYGNGKIIDFFAIMNNGWYHIQAGYQN